MRTLAWLLVVLPACAAPLPVHDQAWLLRHVAARFDELYAQKGDPDPSRDLGLVRPRLGLPSLAKVDDAFELLVIERGRPATLHAALAAGTTELPLVLTRSDEEPLGNGARAVRYQARVDGLATPGPYDLLLAPEGDHPTRTARAVWLYAEDPAAPRPIQIVQLNDLHVGKHVADLEARLVELVTAINASHPDAVIVTGDLANLGSVDAQERRVATLLTYFDAPVFVVPGNHDLGFDSFSRREYGPGWAHFARAFHPLLSYEVTLGGWQLVGFDSGPSTFSPRIQTRGVSPATVTSLADTFDRAHSDGKRGVVLFSHAPTRANLHGDGRGFFGNMRDGGPGLERAILASASPDLPIVHLAGHTHWSDVFDRGSDGAFHRWPTLTACPRPLGTAALVTTQAAAHAGLPFKESARGWGFAVLSLDHSAAVRFRRFGLPKDEPWVCAAPATASAPAPSHL